MRRLGCTRPLQIRERATHRVLLWTIFCLRLGAHSRRRHLVRATASFSSFSSLTLLKPRSIGHRQLWSAEKQP